MELLFSNHIGEAKMSNELGRYKDLGNPCPKQSNIWGVLLEQAINSAIVGGIAGLAALASGVEGSGKTALIAFGVTFLVELRKYRKI